MDNINRYNISLFSDYSICNFFEKLDSGVSVREAKKMYEDFYGNHLSEINESANYALGGKSLNECVSTFGTRMLNEDFSIDELIDALDDDDDNGGVDGNYGKDGIPNDEVKIKATDSEDEKAKKVNQVLAQLDDDDSRRMVDNKPDDPTSLYDIHYLVDMFYTLLMDGQFKIMKNTDERLPICLLDTRNIKDFTAVFAFKDLPNIDLEEWDVRKGIKFDGCFYKSTFNNPSIKNWRLRDAESVKNMFVGSNMSYQEVIDTWRQTKGAGLATVPSLNQRTVDKAKEKKDIIVQNIIGDEEAYVAQMNKRMDNIKKRRMMQNNFSESRKHRVMSSEEFINEGFKETVSNIGKGIRSVMITLKNGFKAVIDKTGMFLRANLFDNVIKFAKEKLNGKAYVGYAGNMRYPAKGGYYDYIDKGSKEYENYEYFMSQLTKGSVSESLEINERRVGLEAKEDIEGHTFVNIDAPNWNSKQVRNYIYTILRRIRKRGKVNPETEPTLIVWGAPGIGKTAMAEDMVDAVNTEFEAKTDEEKMGIIIVDCTNLGAGDLSMPMPVKNADVAALIASNKEAQELKKKYGFTDEDFADVEFAKSNDAPKTWLPVYKPTGDKQKDEVLDAYVNGAVVDVYDKYGMKTGEYTKTGRGGILLFDELFRTTAKENLMIIAQLMKERRTMGGYVLGSKWYIMAASNRPTDDTDIAKRFAEAPDAMKSRPKHCNYVPTFGEWKKWASEKGRIDPWTINWIGEDTKKRWHNIDPEHNRSGYVVRMVCPRSWTQVMRELNQHCDDYDITDHNFTKLPNGLWKQTMESHLPDDIVQDYMDAYPREGGTNVKWTYDYIIEHPKEKITDDTTSTTISDRLKKGIINHYDAGNRIPEDVLKNIVEFMETNFPDASGETAFLLCATLNLCDIKGSVNRVRIPEDRPYMQILTDFANKHSGIDIMTLKKTAKFGK